MDAEKGGRAIIAIFVGIVIVSFTLNAVAELNPIFLITGSLLLFALLAVWVYWKPKVRKRASTPSE